MSNFVKDITSHIEIFSEMKNLESKIDQMIDELVSALKNNKKLIICGNGGSASDSQHIAAEFVGRFKEDRKALNAISLNTDTSILTAIANDYGFENVFSRQIEATGNDGDILLAISTSGLSENILRAAKVCNKNNIKVFSLTGQNKTELTDISDISLQIKSSDTARIQECHIFLGQYLCQEVEKKMGLV